MKSYEIPFSRSRRGSAMRTFIVVFASIFIIALILAIAIPNFIGGRDGGGRSRVSRVRSDLRSIATALESYYIDSNAYPMWSAKPGENAFIIQSPSEHAIYDKLPTFMVRTTEHLMDTLTTPVSYITTYFADPFSPGHDQSFCYWWPLDSKGVGWILWSAGPDGKFDLTMENIAKAYDPSKSNPNEYLTNLTYDPTNGVPSAGDVYRLKE